MKFKSINIGETFYMEEEDGEEAKFQKISEKEAILIENGIATEFSPNYEVIYPIRLFCIKCGKSVSNELPEETIVRAICICPECIE